MLGQPTSLPGYEVPLHRALTEPILIAGAPRAFAILNGTLAAAIGLGLRPWLPRAPLRARRSRPGAPAGARRAPDLARRPRRRRVGHEARPRLLHRPLPPRQTQRSTC